MLVVRVEEPDGAERTLSFEKTTLMIGRTEGNDVCLRSSKGVSRYHARADVEDGVVVIQDLDSTNGTYVNSDRVQRKALALDDLVMIGDVVLSFSVRDDEAEPAVQDQEEDTSSVSQSELLAAETAWKEEAPVSERRSAEAKPSRMIAASISRKVTTTTSLGTIGVSPVRTRKVNSADSKAMVIATGATKRLGPALRSARSVGFSNGTTEISVLVIVPGPVFGDGNGAVDSATSHAK